MAQEQMNDRLSLRTDETLQCTSCQNVDGYQTMAKFTRMAM